MTHRVRVYALGESRLIRAFVWTSAQQVATAYGQVPLGAPLTVRFDARSLAAEVEARQLRDMLRSWGYCRCEVVRGLGKRLKGVRA